jgi:hypothetical protein
MTEKPLDTSRPFTRAAGVRAGLCRQLRTGAYRQVLHGIYLAAEVEVTPLVLARAALLPFGELAWASHVSAARVLGVPIPTLPGEHVTVVERKERRHRTDVTCHSTARGWVATRDGVRVSAPQQLFVELGTMLSLVDLVVVGDHLVGAGLLSLTALRQHCASVRGPGAARARAAAAFVRARVDSPMETRLRLLVVLAGLPEPEVNPVMDVAGRVRRYDLVWRAARLIVEYDGRHHVERVTQWESDLDRREEVDDNGWRIVVVTAAGIYRRPDITLAKIQRLLIERGQPAVPRRLADEWPAHFPVRGDYLTAMVRK